VNAEVLKALARSSGGDYFTDLARLNETLSGLRVKTSEEETVQYRSLWQTWGIIACLMALLSLEWSLRKWRNLP
jgi:hypothetical protein